MGYIALRHSDGSEIRYFSPEWKGNMMIHNALLDPRLQQEDELNVATVLRNSEFLLSNLVRKKEDKERWIYKYFEARHQIDEGNLHPDLTHRYLYNLVQPLPNIRQRVQQQQEQQAIRLQQQRQLRNEDRRRRIPPPVVQQQQQHIIEEPKQPQEHPQQPPDEPSMLEHQDQFLEFIADFDFNQLDQDVHLDFLERPL
jgi:hypothetical protein